MLRRSLVSSLALVSLVLGCGSAARSTSSSDVDASSVAPEAAAGPFVARGARLVHAAPASHGEFALDASGVELRGPRTHATLRLRAFGRASSLHALATVAPRADADGAHYDREGLVEWWRPARAGLEEGLTIEAPPPGERGAIVADLAVEGGLSAALEGDAVYLRDPTGCARAFVRDLAARDADGRALDARFELVAGAIRMRVDDASARYPLVIDPTVGIETELQPPDLSNGAALGSSLSARSDALVSGAPSQLVAGKSSGAAYVFRRDPTTDAWLQEARLAPSNGASSDSFGTSVALGADFAVVGAPNHAAGTAITGAAYVFTRSSTGSWTQGQQLVASDAADGDAFGTSVAVVGDLAFVGSMYASVGGVSGAGAVYVFARDPMSGVWSQQTKLTANAPAADDRIGQSLSATSNATTITLVVGAPNHTGSIGYAQGEVLVFVRPISTATWTQQAALAASDGTASDRFGTAVSIDGDVVAIGAPDVTEPALPSASGAVYVFTRTPTSGSWTESPRIFAVDPGHNSFFGTDVALRGSTLVVGASGVTHGGLDTAGAAYFLQRDATGAWSQRIAYASDAAAFDGMGFAVSLDSGRAFVGAYQRALSATTINAGAIYVYDPVVGLAQGAACARAIDCASGFCVDGVCCDQACAGQCQACDATGACKPLDGAPPHAGKTPCAAPYRLCVAGACATSCAATSDCVAADFCSGTSCVAREAQGATCASDEACASGHCVDGVCCDTACTDACAACDLVGHKGACTVVAGAPHGTRACAGGAGDPQCGNRCDGNDTTACHPAGASVACSIQTCTGYTFTASGSCDGNGACKATPAPCPGNLTCGTDGKCKTTCASASDCVAGAPCVNGACGKPPIGTCSADHLSSTPLGGGTATACAPYLCSDLDGACATACATSDQCAPGASCDPVAKTCIAAAPPAASSGGCGVSASGAGAGGSIAALAVLATGLVLARRRRR